MTRTEYLDNYITQYNEELKELFIKTYGEPSHDELVKMVAMKDLYNMTARQKIAYIDKCDMLKKLATDKDFEDNRISISDRINYQLTLIKLLSIYGKKINNYSLFYCVTNIDNENSCFESIGDLFVLLDAFNKIKVDDYPKFEQLFFDRYFLNNILKNSVGSDESINSIRKKIDYAIKKYRDEYEQYDDINRKLLNKEIVEELKEGIYLRKRMK